MLFEGEALAYSLLQPKTLVLAACEQGDQVGLHVFLTQRTRLARQICQLGADFKLDAGRGLN
jgi:hypothetical protein